MKNHQASSFIGRCAEVLSNIRQHELPATCVSFAIAFLLMASYFLLRPVRDAMASDWSDTEVSYLWNLQFFVSIAVVSAYSMLMSRVQFRTLVPLVYGLFAISFVIFYLVTPLFAEPTVLEKSYYLWVSSFSLFHLSVFWSLMADTFSKEQSKRLFSVIAAGASAGAIVGPIVPALFAGYLMLDTLMLMAACGLLLVIPLVLVLHRLKAKQLGVDQPTKGQRQVPASALLTNKGWWTGFRDVIANRYLFGIAVFILLYVFIGSFVYFEQKNLLAEFSRPERAQILGRIDWVVNTLTFVVAFFVTGRLVTRIGMPITFALLPLMMLVGLLILAIAPMVLVIMCLQVARRVGNYSVTRPAREMLFTQVSKDERFKAKPVIDVVVYRGGDAVSGSFFALLSEGLGLGLAAIALIGAGISSLWAAIALRIGLRYESTHLSGINAQFKPEPLS